MVARVSTARRSAPARLNGAVTEPLAAPAAASAVAPLVPGPGCRTLVVGGVSGVGKTTVARLVAGLLGWDFAEGDAFHPASNVAKMAAGHPLVDDDRWPWLASIAAWIGGQEAVGASSVVACSSLRRRYRDALATGHPSVGFCLLVADPATLDARLTHRHGHFMPASLLTSQLATFEPIEPDERGWTVVSIGPPPSVAEAVAKVARAPW